MIEITLDQAMNIPTVGTIIQVVNENSLVMTMIKTSADDSYISMYQNHNDLQHRGLASIPDSFNSSVEYIDDGHCKYFILNDDYKRRVLYKKLIKTSSWLCDHDMWEGQPRPSWLPPVQKTKPVEVTQNGMDDRMRGIQLDWTGITIDETVNHPWEQAAQEERHQREVTMTQHYQAMLTPRGHNPELTNTYTYVGTPATLTTTDGAGTNGE